MTASTIQLPRRLGTLLLTLSLLWLAACSNDGSGENEDDSAEGPILFPQFSHRTLLMAPGQQTLVGLRIDGPAGKRDFDKPVPDIPNGAGPIQTDVTLAVVENDDDTARATVDVGADAAPGIYRLPIEFSLRNDDGSSTEVEDLVVVVLPTDAYATAGPVSGVAAGAFHSLALLDDGSVRAWGRNQAGQLGDGTLIDRQVPVPVAGLPGPAVAVAAGEAHSLALLADGSVFGWGSLEHEQAVPIGVVGADVQPLPYQLEIDDAKVTGAIAIAAGDHHSVVLLNDGRILVWGGNGHGQLGSRYLLDTSSRYNTVDLLTGAQAIAAGGDHVLALANDGTAWAWGRSNSGQLGGAVDGPLHADPIDIGFVSGVTGVAAGHDHTLLLLDDGNVGGLGANSSGQLGDGSLNSPIAQPLRPPNLLNVVAADGGWVHSLALQANRQVYAWGDNAFGQLSDAADPAPDSLGRLLQRVPQRVTGLPPSDGIAAGGRHSLSIDDACDKVWSFGDNGNGQLGDAGATVFGEFRAPPLPVYGLGDSGAVSGCRMLLSVAGHGDGSISVQPDSTVSISDADCAHPCVTSYPRDTAVTLTAAPAADWVFDGWYGNCAGTEPSIGVSMDRSRACLARFLRPPIASFTVETNVISLGFDILTDFDAKASTDPDGMIVDYEWDFDGDGEFGEEGANGDPTPWHTFDNLGSFDVALRVTDNDGLTDIATRTIVVTTGPIAAASITPEAPAVGDSVTFDASASTTPNGAIAEYRWDFGDDGSIDASGVITQRIYDAPGSFDVRLHVVDDLGLGRSTRLTVQVTAESAGGSVDVVNFGGGNGQVFSVPNLLQCLFSGASSTPDPCTAPLAAGQTVQLVAVADASSGSVFSHWGEADCDSTATLDGLPACNVSGPGARSVAVYFE